MQIIREGTEEEESRREEIKERKKKLGRIRREKEEREMKEVKREGIRPSVKEKTEGKRDNREEESVTKG